MLLDDLKRIAKELLVRDGYHVPMFFLCSEEHIIGEPLLTGMFDEVYKDNLNAENSKTRAVFCMGALAKKIGANRLVMIWDAAMRTGSGNISRDQTESPLTYPKSMRTECLILNDISFVTGKDSTIIIPYKGGDGEPVELLNDNIIPEGAVFDSRFTEIAIKGYNKVS